MEKKEYIMNKCVEMIRTFDPVTHSIDSHCEQLGDINIKTAKPENIFIHQVVYGWYRERAVVEGFISSFYKDNSHCIARSDRIIYTVLAYLAIFRLDELGFHRFKELTMTQNPTKTNLWGCLRAEWMKVRDLSFVENEIIAGVEQYLSELTRFCNELNKQAQDIEAVEAAKEAARKSGSVGLGEVTKKGLTRPVSPKLTRPKVFSVPEPERIDQSVVANPVPRFINNITLSDIESQRTQSIEKERQRVQAKYTEEQQFNLHSTAKGETKLQELKKEIEVKSAAELDFNKKFRNEPPDFSKIPAPVRANTSVVLREDALFRKQQEKDALLLKKYEEELRDTSDYYLWQQEMRDFDHKQRLDQVALRREMAKQSAEEAKAAMNKQKEDNKTVADLLREQGEAIKQKLLIEDELELLRNQEVARQLQAIRDSKPKEALEKVAKEKKTVVDQMNVSIEEKLRQKIEEEKEEEERKADRIRQLRAMNTIHKPFVKVFDPTTHAGVGLLDEMSYAEMKERQAIVRSQVQTEESTRRLDILEEKQKKAKEMEARTASILRARQIKAEANKSMILKRREAAKAEEEGIEEARQKAAALLNRELTEKREAKQQERDILVAEEDRVRRQQQYLGAAMGAVEEMREMQQQLAKDRQALSKQKESREEAQLMIQVKKSDEKNRKSVQREARLKNEAEQKMREESVEEDKKRSVQWMKEKTLINKHLFHAGTTQHERTRAVVTEHNPYAIKISQQSLQTVRTSRSGGGSTRRDGLTGTFSRSQSGKLSSIQSAAQNSLVLA